MYGSIRVLPAHHQDIQNDTVHEQFTHIPMPWRSWNGMCQHFFKWYATVGCGAAVIHGIITGFYWEIRFKLSNARLKYSLDLRYMYVCCGLTNSIQDSLVQAYRRSKCCVFYFQGFFLPRGIQVHFVNTSIPGNSCGKLEVHVVHQHCSQEGELHIEVVLFLVVPYCSRLL